MSSTSHPITPTNQSKSKKSNSRLGLRLKRQQANQQKKSSSDPLVRFPIDVSCRIFTLVGLGSDGLGGHFDGHSFSAVKDLLNCGLVSKKWRTSSVINYVWFKLFTNQTSHNNSLDQDLSSSNWTRQESKTHWDLKYKELNQIKSNQEESSDEEIDPKTLRWQELNKPPTKAELRAKYKELGGKRIKFKPLGRGADRTGWQDMEDYE